MPRTALMARLLDARRQRCVVIQGPAGSAKTSALLAWRQALLTLDFDVAWLSLAPEDDDLTAFFNGLLAKPRYGGPVDRSRSGTARRA